MKKPIILFNFTKLIVHLKNLKQLQESVIHIVSQIM